MLSNPSQIKFCEYDLSALILFPLSGPSGSFAFAFMLSQKASQVKS